MSLRGRSWFSPEAIPVLGGDCFAAQEQERRLATTSRDKMYGGEQKDKFEASPSGGRANTPQLTDVAGEYFSYY